MVPRFTVLGTLAVAAKIYVRNFVSFTILALIVYAPLISYAIWGMNRAMGTTSSRDAGGIVVVVVFAGTYLLSKVLAGAVAFGVFNQLRETHVSLGSCVTNGIRRLIPVLLTSLVLAILIAIGTVAYVLPGIVAACLTYVAVPAAVVEGIGPFAAFVRSVRLVDKSVPRVFLLFVVFVALQLGAYVLLRMIVDAVLATSMLRICLFMAATMLFGAFDAVLSSVAYAHLRVDRDGIGVGELARVFD